jgi:heme exporter protein CcmD
VIEGGWNFVAPAYAATVLGLGALALVIFLRARHWARRVRELEQKR